MSFGGQIGSKFKFHGIATPDITLFAIGSVCPVRFSVKSSATTEQHIICSPYCSATQIFISTSRMYLYHKLLKEHKMRNSKERLQRYILESQTRPMKGASRGLKLLAFMYKLIGRKTIAHSLVCSRRCDSCGACVRACPNKAISLKGTSPLRNRHCRGCLLCVYACPKRAFEIPVLALVGACVLLFLPFDDWIIQLFSLNIPKDYHSAKYAISSLVLWGIGYAIALFVFEALVMLLSRTALFKRLGEIPWVHRLREKINPVRVFPAILPRDANAERIREKRNSY